MTFTRKDAMAIAVITKVCKHYHPEADRHEALDDMAYRIAKYLKSVDKRFNVKAFFKRAGVDPVTAVDTRVHKKLSLAEIKRRGKDA